MGLLLLEMRTVLTVLASRVMLGVESSEPEAMSNRQTNTMTPRTGRALFYGPKPRGFWFLSEDGIPRRLYGRDSDRWMNAERGAIPMDQWAAEPAPTDESSQTAGGEGWVSWNGWSPEKAFCEFAAALVALNRPGLVVETGIGQGYTTRRVLPVLSGRYLGFESDDDLRARLRNLDVWSDTVELADDPEASPEILSACDLAILDSDLPQRKREIDRWLEYASPGAFVLVHDARPDHPVKRSPFRWLARYLGDEGVFLGNPRGAWLCRKPLPPG